MANNNPEIAKKLSGIQNQIWQSVSIAASEAAGTSIKFENPESVELSPSELAAHLSEPCLIIQFSFSSSPECSQVITIEKDAVLGYLSAIKGEELEDATEALIEESKEPIEALVQGICVSVGNMRNQAFSASGLSIRFQTPSLPPNLAGAETVFSTGATMSGENFSGEVTWIIDVDTAMGVVGIEADVEDKPRTSHSAVIAERPGDSLEMLMDIPLQISVELGRVKMVVKDVVELGAGSIIEIDKAAGEPVDVMVNGRTVARGEVVVIEDNFGVRITEIVSQQDRLAKLKEAA